MRCKVNFVQGLLGKKWTIQILEEINSRKSVGYNRLEESIKGITAKLLARRLKELRNEGIIERLVISEKPLKVEYKISRKGKDLLVVFRKLKEWGAKYSLVSKECIKKNCNECLK